MKKEIPGGVDQRPRLKVLRGGRLSMDRRGGGPVHISVVVRQVMAEISKRKGERIIG